MVDEGGFIEHAQFSGNCYGTSFKAVRDVAKLNRICILDIEMEVRFLTSLLGSLACALLEQRKNGKMKISFNRCDSPIDFFFHILQGVKQMKRTSMDARFVFLEPPSMEVLRERLCGRGTETEESIERRMDQAKREIAFAKESKVHDKIIVNNDLNKAYEAFKEWVFEEKRDQEQEQEQELAQA